MAIRLSDLNEYSTAVAVTPSVQPVSASYVPTVAATHALMRRGSNGLALSEFPTRERARLQRLNGLGELVQVVT